MTTAVPTFLPGGTIRAADLNALARAVRELQMAAGGGGGGGGGGGPADSLVNLALRAGPTAGVKGGWYAGRMLLGRVVTRSRSAPGLRAAVTYTVKVFGRGEEMAALTAPAFDPFMPGTVITPAAVGDPCVVIFQPLASGGVDSQIWAFTEKAAAHGFFPVLVTQTGGSAGSQVPPVDCSFVYTVKDLSGTTLGTGMSPVKRRDQRTQYEAPPADTPGVGYYQADGAFRLWDANERIATAVCETSE